MRFPTYSTGHDRCISLRLNRPESGPSPVDRNWTSRCKCVFLLAASALVPTSSWLHSSARTPKQTNSTQQTDFELPIQSCATSDAVNPSHPHIIFSHNTVHFPLYSLQHFITHMKKPLGTSSNSHDPEFRTKPCPCFRASS